MAQALNTPSTPKVRWKNKRIRGRTNFWFIFLALAPLWIATFMAPKFFTVLWSQSTTGKITDRVAYVGDDDESECYVSYRYRVNGVNYQSSSPVSYATIQSPVSYNGEPITVRYFPLMPGYGPILPFELLSAQLLSAGFWILLGSLIPWVIAYQLSAQMRLQRTLMRHGRLVKATIIEKTIEQGAQGSDGRSGNLQYAHSVYELHYIFTLEEESSLKNNSRFGNVIQNRALVTRAEWLQAEVGDEMPLLYAPDNPTRNLLLAYSDLEIVN